MDTLKHKVHSVVEGYAGKMLNGHSYLTKNEDGSVYSVVDVVGRGEKRSASVSLIIRILDDLIFIERDQNDKLVVDALVQAGVPREQIILAYAGEPVPETAL